MRLAASAFALLATSFLSLQPLQPLYAQTAASTSGATAPTASLVPAPPATKTPAAKTPAAQAPDTKAPPAKLAQIEAIVTNLGYTPKQGAAGTWFTITYAAKNNYRIDFSLSADKSVLYIYISYGISAAQLKVMPSVALLEWNDNHRTYLSLSKEESQLSLNVNMPTASLAPKSLRQAIGQLAGDADRADKIFYPGNW